MAKYILKDNTRAGVSAIRSVDGSGDRIITSLNGEDVIKDAIDSKTKRPIKKVITGATQELLSDLYNNTEKWGPYWKTILVKIEDRDLKAEDEDLKTEASEKGKGPSRKRKGRSSGGQSKKKDAAN
jgi:hypothetical protein